MTLDRDSSTFFPLEFGHHFKLLWHGTAQHISFNQQMLIQTLKFTDVTNVQCSYQMHLNDSSTLFRYRIQEFICSTDDCSQQKWYKVRGASKSGWNRIEYFKRRLRFKDFFTAHCFQLGIPASKSIAKWTRWKFRKMVVSSRVRFSSAPTLKPFWTCSTIIIISEFDNWSVCTPQFGI